MRVVLILGLLKSTNLATTLHSKLGLYTDPGAVWGYYGSYTKPSPISCLVLLKTCFLDYLKKIKHQNNLV